MTHCFMQLLDNQARWWWPSAAEVSTDSQSKLLDAEPRSRQTSLAKLSKEMWQWIRLRHEKKLTKRFSRSQTSFSVSPKSSCWLTGIAADGICRIFIPPSGNPVEISRW